MAANKKTTVFLRPDYDLHARRHIEDYLNAEYPDFQKVVADLSALNDNAEKIIVAHYEGQCQVTAFFVGEKTGSSYGVGGLGETLDLAIMSCYVKCHFVLKWQFESDVEADTPAIKPRFS